MSLSRAKAQLTVSHVVRRCTQLPARTARGTPASFGTPSQAWTKARRSLYPSRGLATSSVVRTAQPSAGTTPNPPPVPKKFALRPYMELARIDRPAATWLLYFPCTWSITLASHFTGAPISVWLTNLALFGVGSFVMRGAGCTINDMWDAKIDAKIGTYAATPD